MKILFLTINYAPELISTAKYNTELAQFCAERGHEIKVIAATPYYPNWRSFPGYNAYKYQTEIINNVQITHCPLFIPINPTGFKRALHLLSFAISSLWPLFKALRWKADIIFFVEPTFATFPGALLYSKLTRAKTFLHIQDLEIDAAFNLKFYRGNFLKNLLTKFELFTFKRCTTISTISNKMRENIIEKYKIAQNKIYYLPNWVDTDVIRPLEFSKFRIKLNIALDKIVCLYSGNLGIKQGLEIIIDVAEKFKSDSKYVFIICGNGANRTRLQTIAKQKLLSNIIWLNLQPNEELNELLNSADIHLLPQKDSIANCVFPSKLTGMLASGKPIVATALPNTEVYKQVKDCGIPVAPGDIKSFVAAIKNLGDNNTLRQKLGIAARKIAENNFAKKTILSNFYNLLSI